MTSTKTFTALPDALTAQIRREVRHCISRRVSRRELERVITNFRDYARTSSMVEYGCTIDQMREVMDYAESAVRSRALCMTGKIPPHTR